jgi:hypothetical protein
MQVQINTIKKKILEGTIGDFLSDAQNQSNLPKIISAFDDDKLEKMYLFCLKNVKNTILRLIKCEEYCKNGSAHEFMCICESSITSKYKSACITEEYDTSTIFGLYIYMMSWMRHRTKHPFDDNCPTSANFQQMLDDILNHESSIVLKFVD